MGRHSDAALPVRDAGMLVLSVIAQTLLARRYLESWLFWIATDCLAIGLYLTRGLGPTAALYTVFLGLAIWGWLDSRGPAGGSRAASRPDRAPGPRG